MCSGENHSEKVWIIASKVAILLSALLFFACNDSNELDQHVDHIVLDDAEQRDTILSYSCMGSRCRIATCTGQGRKSTTSRCLTMGDRTWGASASTDLMETIDLSQYDTFSLWFRAQADSEVSQMVEMTVTITGTNEFHQRHKRNLSQIHLGSWNKIGIPIPSVEDQTFLLSFEIQLLTGGEAFVFHFDDVSLTKKEPSANLDQSVVVVSPVYPAHASWNEYVRNDDLQKDVFHQDDDSCTTDDGPGYWSCIHGGEKRKVVVANETSCNGLTARDQLGAFDWQCVDRTGTVEWFSMGLKRDARLSDLIVGTTGTWRKNQVVIKRNGDLVARSEPAIWWTNPLIDLESVADPRPATAAIELEVPGAIYYLANDFSSPKGYAIEAERIAVTILGDAILSYADDADGVDNCRTSLCLLDANPYPDSFGIWVEGRFAGDNLGRVDKLVAGERLSFAVVRHVEAFSAAERAVDLRGIRDSLVTDIYAHDNIGRGFQLHGRSHGVEVQRIETRRNTLDGIYIANVQESRLSDLTTTHNGQNGIRLTSSSANFVQGIHATHNQLTGLKLATSRDHVQNIFVAHNGALGLNARFFHGSMAHVVATDNNGHGLQISPSNDGSFLVAVTAANNSRMGVDIYNSSQSTIVGLAAINNDGNGLRLLTNANDHQIYASTLASNAKDQLRMETQSSTFEDLHIIDSRDFPDTDGWDWSLRASDTTLLGQTEVPDGNTVGTFFWKAADANECVQLGGAWNTPSTGDCTGPFLLHAYEVMNDNIGNDNNLCQNGETCIYTPNHGAYQGHGNLVPIKFVDGVVSGVTLLQWSTNGR